MELNLYLTFINDYSPVSRELLRRELTPCLPIPVKFIPVNMDLKLFYSVERNQYYSTLILSHLLKFLPEDGLKIIGITPVDLYIPIMTFLFGEAQLDGAGAIVSSCRLNSEFYGLPPDPPRFYSRLKKEILHETGHTLGLIHCQENMCVMHSSTSVDEVDLKDARFCPECREQIGVTCKAE